MLISSCIHVAANGIISFFLRLSGIPLNICTTSLSIHLKVGHFSGFHVLAIVNRAAMNVSMHVSFLKFFLLEYCCFVMLC